MNEPAAPHRNPIRIAALEDDPAICKLLAQVLAEDCETRFARDGEHLVSLVELGLVQLVLLDLMLPAENGLDVGRRLRARSEVPIIILSALADPEHIVEGLDAFADDYVTKPFTPEVLRSRIRSVSRRSAQRLSESGGMALFDIELSGCRLLAQERALSSGVRGKVHLTEREYRILVHLCRCAGRVVTRLELSQTVCGRDWDPTDRSLDVHVCNLRTKVDRVSPGRRLIRAARGTGYFLDCAPRFVDRDAAQGLPKLALSE